MPSPKKVIPSELIVFCHDDAIPADAHLYLNRRFTLTRADTKPLAPTGDGMCSVLLLLPDNSAVQLACVKLDHTVTAVEMSIPKQVVFNGESYALSESDTIYVSVVADGRCLTQGILTCCVAPPEIESQPEREFEIGAPPEMAKPGEQACERCHGPILGKCFYCPKCSVTFCQFCELIHQEHRHHYLIRRWLDASRDDMQRLEKDPRIMFMLDNDRSDHGDAKCNYCHKLIKGARYECDFCYHYDLCSKCERRGIHAAHDMYRHRDPRPPSPLY
eukprot:m.49790 g.49790  ORF g.49790 m.49790 type:complete len:274 (+) comp6496_c0_seq1:96-917(+)